METDMDALTRRICFMVLGVLALVSFGCGGGSGNSTTSPNVDTSKLLKIQVAVDGATVFPDNVAAGTRFINDAGEAVARPTTVGNYSLSAFPSYDFILVSTGGKDTITGQDALLLLAPAGSTNITPLTTLVTLDTSKTVQAKLEALNGGRKFDTNVSTDASQAILMLIKSAETAVHSVSEAVKQAATDAQPVATLTQSQINYIQAQAWQHISLELARTSQNLATPAGLLVALNAATNNAIKAIKAESKNSNISSFDSSTAPALIANNSVNAAMDSLFGATAVTSTSTAPLATTKTESPLLNQTTVFENAVFATANALNSSTSVVVVGVTPNPYTPTPIPVVTVTNATILQILTGSSGGTSGTGVTFKSVMP